MMLFYLLRFLLKRYLDSRNPQSWTDWFTLDLFEKNNDLQEAVKVLKKHYEETTDQWAILQGKKLLC